MKELFQKGDRVHKIDDYNSGVIKEIENDNAYCEFSVVKTLDEDQSKPIIELGKKIPIVQHVGYEYEWVPIKDLKHFME